MAPNTNSLRSKYKWEEGTDPAEMAGVLKVAIAESSYTLKQALQHYSGRDRASKVQVCGASKLGKQPKLINSQSSVAITGQRFPPGSRSIARGRLDAFC
ncbi:MAG: hypothetical protein BRC36_14060 [Cyanobacteria bacterium QH_2_48_84]|nr:MAG: hypothetical protein BRC36_14060 [Cyanobacteria bacterium QH_2_48_84]